MHGHGTHAHGHGPVPGGRFSGRLLFVLVLTFLVMGLEVVGGILSGSVALLADAGHMLADSAGLLLSWLALRFAARPATEERTFGYLRAEALAAFANAALLLVVGGWVVLEALQRLTAPPVVAGGTMLVFASIGAVANLLGVILLHAGRRENLALRGAYLEVLGDLLASVAVVVAAVLVATVGFARADPIAGLAIGALILPRAYVLLREAVHVLLESTPKGMDLREVRAHVLEVPGVVAVHDMHAWSLGTGAPVLSAHVVVDDRCFRDGTASEVLDSLQHCLAGHFDVVHSTFQLETSEHGAHEPAAHS